MRMMTILVCGLVILMVSVSGASAATIQVSFGVGDLEGWNTLSNVTADISNLADSTGASTGVSLTTDDTNRFFGANDRGPDTPQPPASNLFPGTVADSTFYAAYDYGTAIMTLSGLDTESLYTFYVFSSRAVASVSCATTFSFAGEATAAQTIESGGNVSEYLTFSEMAPDAQGDIVLTVSPGAGNTYYYYLNAMIIEAVPEPATMSALALGGLGVLVRRRRK